MPHVYVSAWVLSIIKWNKAFNNFLNILAKVATKTLLFTHPRLASEGFREC